MALAVGWKAPVVHAPAPTRSGAAQGAAALDAWLGDLAGARKEAAERNVVLLLHVILEGEPQNDDYRNDLLPHPKLLELSQRAVVMVANNGQHKLETYIEKVDGLELERRRCSVYPMFESCVPHNAPWLEIYRELQEDTGELRCPQTVIEQPGGELAWRYNVANPPPAAELVQALERAQKAAGPGLTSDQVRAVKSAAFDARNMQRAQGFAAAWKHWQEVLALTQRGVFAEEARAGQVACMEALGAELAAARALLVPGTGAQGYAKLLELLAACAGMPNERELKKEVRDAERNPEVRGEIARYKLELEAEALFDEGVALFDAGDERRAERTIARLLKTPKYADTPAARKAAERFPQWVPEKES